MKKVTFQSEDLTLAGNLYFPSDFDQSNKYPAVVAGGSLTSVKEQMAGRLKRNMTKLLKTLLSSFTCTSNRRTNFPDPAKYHAFAANLMGFCLILL